MGFMNRAVLKLAADIEAMGLLGEAAIVPGHDDSVPIDQDRPHLKTRAGSSGSNHVSNREEIVVP